MTEISDTTLLPMPDKCPIPPGVVAHIGGYHGERPHFVLWRDGKQVVIEAPKTNWRKYLSVDKTNACYGYYCWDAQLKVHGEYLEILQSLLPYIKFGVTNWAYLLKDKTGKYFVRHRQRITKSISCPIWATLIPEDEIEYTVFGKMSYDRRGIWKNKKVDIHYGWDERELWALDRCMYGYRAAQGLDLTYEVYGHLMGRDGAIIGLVSEAANGRMICSTDKALVYMSITKLQNAGILYRACYTNQFMIQDGKIRLIELNGIVKYESREQLVTDAERWHWQSLDELFQEFEIYGEIGYYRRPATRFRTSWKDLYYVLPKFSPGRPMGGILYYIQCFHDDFNVNRWNIQDHLISNTQRKNQPLVENHDSDEPFQAFPLRRFGQSKQPHTFKNNRDVILAHHPYRRINAHDKAVGVTTASGSLSVAGTAPTTLRPSLTTGLSIEKAHSSVNNSASALSLPLPTEHTFSNEPSPADEEIEDVLSPAVAEAFDEYPNQVMIGTDTFVAYVYL